MVGTCGHQIRPAELPGLNSYGQPVLKMRGGHISWSISYHDNGSYRGLVKLTCCLSCQCLAGAAKIVMEHPMPSDGSGRVDPS